MPRWQKQVGGALIALIGAAGTIWMWHAGLTTGDFDPEGSMLMPAFFVVGLALTLFPDYTEERLARGENVSTLKGWRKLTPRWRAVVILGLAAGAANHYLLSKWALSP